MIAESGIIQHYSGLSGDGGAKAFWLAVKAFVTAKVTVCDGKCYGSGFGKYLIINICDGVTDENPQGGGAMLNSKC
jgi:hypothetical protein